MSQDRQFFPVLVANARRGKTKYAIGDGKNVADFTFVGNVAHGHLLAAHKVKSSQYSACTRKGRHRLCSLLRTWVSPSQP